VLNVASWSERVPTGIDSLDTLVDGG